MKTTDKIQENVVFLKTAAGLGMRIGIRYTGITSNMVSEWYSDSCEKGDDRALYMTRCAAI
ncbi:hypothetical protein E2C01_041525 [Portunus trituberculatus]|uniref:Uncharacterized protein n=1 Tax=Portunus trituberculatus TaxID=210409 RepID=A0A5B7FR62_PORTR|nr:hypothetical protein [Portunus trituberculatus]